MHREALTATNLGQVTYTQQRLTLNLLEACVAVADDKLIQVVEKALHVGVKKVLACQDKR